MLKNLKPKNPSQYSRQSNTIEMDLHKQKYTAVMSALIEATHCHNCGKALHVSLIGYAGKFCEKACWYAFENTRQYIILGEDEEGYIYKQIPPTCIFGSVDCAHFVSLANDIYRDRIWENENSVSGVVWPMCGLNKVCMNECIKTIKPIAIDRDTQCV